MEVFQRVEQKYILDEDEYEKLFDKLKNHLTKDIYYRSTICNIYFDTDNYDLIVNSIDKAPFKQKIRIRSYNIPKINDKVFLELKCKFKGVVFKRRVKMKLNDIYDYLEDGSIRENSNDQIMKEIDYVIKKSNLKPKLFLAYDRLSYYANDNKNLRVTFDNNLRSRDEDLKLELGDAGKKYTKDNFYIMEIKSRDSIPLWFSSILNELKIYPNTFSKYGNIYKKNSGGDVYV